jgi:hypothetical protein
VKRSQNVRLLLLGGLSAGAFATSAAAAEPRVSPESYYTNDYPLPGAGYYHAPFRAFFPLPYNHYDAQRKMYFYGGQWSATPHRSVINISNPTPEAASAAQSLRTDLQSSTYVPRSGFGSTSHGHGIYA